MVTRSIDDYEQHKKDIYKKFLNQYGEKAKTFIKFYSHRYDKFKRSFLNYKVAWSIFDDYVQVKKTGIRWYAIVGTGGSGKSTLAKNVLYFLDPSFNQNRITTTAEGLVKILHSYPAVGAMKASLLDEPDQTIYPQSKEGNMLRSIFGKSRQQKIFMAYCATDMRDIPNYIYKKISGIFFTPYIGMGMFFKDRPKKLIYVVADLKNDYLKLGYKAFFKYAKSDGCLKFKATKKTPLTQEEEQEYLDKKEEDYKNDIETFLEYSKKKKMGKTTQEGVKEKLIKNMKAKGLTDGQVATYFGVSRSRVSQIIRKMR